MEPTYVGYGSQNRNEPNQQIGLAILGERERERERFYLYKIYGYHLCKTMPFFL